MNIHKIYILYTGVFCKVGVTTRNVETRLKEIQTSCPLPIYKYSYISNLSKADSFYIENKLKTHLENHHIKGEWYREFPNLIKSLSYLIKTHTIKNKFEILTVNTKESKFEDISVTKLNEINLHRKNNDLTKLSILYTQFINNKDYRSNRFFMYPKDEVLRVLENAIGVTINYYEKNSIVVKKEDEKSLLNNKKKLESNIFKNDKQLRKNKTKEYNSNIPRKKNNQKSQITSAFYERISREIENGDLS